MVVQLAASSRREMQRACVTAHRWVLCWDTSNWTRTQECACARPSVYSRARRIYGWLWPHLRGKPFLLILFWVSVHVHALSCSLSVSLWGLSHKTHPTRIHESFLQNSESSCLCMGSICQILADLPSVAPVSVSLLFWTCIQHCAEQYQWCQTPFCVPIPAIFGCKQFNISSATRSVPVCFARSTPCWSWLRIYFSILNFHSAIDHKFAMRVCGVCGLWWSETMLN